MNAEALIRDASIVFLVLVTLSAVSVIARTLRNGVAPMPSSNRVQSQLVALLRSLPLEPMGTVAELGSGWGSMSLALCRALPSMNVVGYENSSVPFLVSLAVRWLFGVRNLRLVKEDFHKVQLREADLVVCYLSPEAMERLQPKFAAELKPSAVVISSTFALREWTATRVVEADDLYRTRIYLYHVRSCKPDDTGKIVDIVEPESHGEDRDGDA